MEAKYKKVLKRMINLSYLLAVLTFILGISKSLLFFDFDYTKAMYSVAFFIGFIGINLSVILKHEGGMQDVEITPKEKFMKYFGLLVIALTIGFIVWFCWRIGVFDLLMSQ